MDYNLYSNMVGVTGFEPAAFDSRNQRATKLRYTPVILNSNRVYYE